MANPIVDFIESRQVFNKYVNRVIEVFEVVIVVALLVLAIYAIVFLV